jgi:uncharacterized protein (TIGR03437 family)
MKRTIGFTASLFVLLLLAVSISASAETVTTVVNLSSANEVPPVQGLNATGRFLAALTVNRDNNGAITGGSITFQGNVNFPGSVTITGLHIHEEVAGKNGSIRFDSGLNANNTLTFANGVGLVIVTGQITNADQVAAISRFLEKPTGFYMNLHTTVNGSGAIRGQIIRYTETQSVTVAMSSANEIPAVSGTGTGVGTITAHPTRKPSTGEVTGGTVTFTIQHDIPAGSVITGLHIHQGDPTIAGPVVINTGVGPGANSITTATGKGIVNYVVPITTQAQLDALKGVLTNAPGFYVNLHTQAFGGGLIRAQLTPLAASPVIQLSNTFFLESGGGDAQVSLLVTGIDLASSILVNGQTVTALPDLATGAVNVTIPAALRANAGALVVQARNSAGILSEPLNIVVAPTASVNSLAITTTDAARFGQLAAPEAILAGFGTKLASQTLVASSNPLPTALDGTSIYVNGVAARLFFVSTNQANYLLPSSTITGPASIVVLAKDGSVSRGALNVSESIPSIFTMNNGGTGAPAALASSDGGVTFPIVMGNPDGTPREISAGNFVMLFGTGIRYGSTPVTIKIGTTDVTPTFAGAQGAFNGLDQINLQIPQSLAGAGEVDLTATIDGKTSNPVRLKIK